MNDQEIIDKTKALLGDRILEITYPAVRRIFLGVEPGHLLEAVKVLRESLGFRHVSTISGVDAGESFELLYHFANSDTQLNVRTKIPKSNPHVESICPYIPGAVMYEREIQEMFGLVVDHIPDPRRLLLSDDWPEGNFPLRKDWKYERPPEKIPGGKS
jgi:membrane-bound hydrogenase subunit beta